MFLKNLVADLVSLRRGATASAIVLLALQLAAPFGLSVDPVIAAAVVTAVGFAVSWAQSGSQLLTDLLTLQHPATAAAAAALLLTAIKPFGLELSEEAVTGALTALGVVVAYGQHLDQPPGAPPKK